MSKYRVYRLNVVEKLRLKDGSWVKLSDFVSIGKSRYPVFRTTRENEGYQIVGFSTAFPIAMQTANPSKAESNIRTEQVQRFYKVLRSYAQQNPCGSNGESGTFFITEAEHPSCDLEFAPEFYAALRLYADNNAGGSDPESKYQELIKIANLSTKKNSSSSERDLYQTTLKAVWKLFENQRNQQGGDRSLDKYRAMVDLEREICYFLLAPGRAGQTALEAKAVAHDHSAMPDWTILYAPLTIDGMEVASADPHVGQSVQIITYPEKELTSNSYSIAPSEKNKLKDKIDFNLGAIPPDLETKASKDCIPQVLTGHVTSFKPWVTGGIGIQLAEQGSTSRTAPVLSEDGTVVGYLRCPDPDNKDQLFADSVQVVVENASSSFARQQHEQINARKVKVVVVTKDFEDYARIPRDALEERVLDSSRVPMAALTSIDSTVGRTVRYGLQDGQIVCIHNLRLNGQKVAVFAVEDIAKGEVIPQSSLQERFCNSAEVPENSYGAVLEVVGHRAACPIPAGSIISIRQIKAN